MKSAILLVSLFALVAAAPAHDIKAEIDAANAKWSEAFNKGDAAAVAQFYTEHATALPPAARWPTAARRSSRFGSVPFSPA